ncbi:MAG: L-fuculose phosphate aldolase [Anaerolineales bacterium]|nr:L-fuculose phosphate aldolase [Anaerolineales bacterium]
MQQIKESLKQVAVDTGKTMIRQGLTVGTWGNISLRDSETGLMYISPSGIDYEDIQVEDIVVLDSELEVVDGFRTPSVERQMHMAMYETRPNVNAVVHTHPLYSTVLGVNHMTLPGVSEDFVQVVGDKIICAEYALPGTPELAEKAAQALGKRNAVLLPNHGTLCVGENMKHALTICHVVEKTAHIYIMARSIGTPHIIAEDDILAMQHFARHEYGQR